MDKMNWYKNKIEFSLQYYSKESNITSKPWSGMIQHIFQLAVVTEEILRHIILFKRIKHGFLGKFSNCGPCATDVLFPHWGVVTEEKMV
jgi:hypothetical protein